MTLLDLLLGLIVGASVISGFVTGFTRTAFGILATVIGIVLGFWFYDVPAAYLKDMLGSQQAAGLFGFFIVFLAVLGIGGLIGRFVSSTLKVVGLGFIDRLGGAAFGLLRGTFIAAAAVTVLLAATPRPVPSWMRGSVLLPYAMGAADLAAAVAPKALKDEVSGSIREIRGAWNEEVQKAKRRAEKALIPGSSDSGEPEEATPPAQEPPKVVDATPAKKSSGTPVTKAANTKKKTPAKKTTP